MFKNVKIDSENETSAQKIGNFGENLAVKYLKKRKYKIIDKNIKIGYKEIDIIAKKKNEFIFIEVKTRIKNDYCGAEDSLNYKKIQHLKKALSIYVKIKKIDPELTRFDLIAIDLDRQLKKAKIKHYKEIF